jgi:3-hydroxybutyrate dehydrogenase
MAQAGAKVMLNGFGKPEDIAAARARSARRWAAARRPIPPPTCRSPRGPRDGGRLREAARRLRHPGEQRRHPVRLPVEDFPEAKWDAIIAINLSSNFHAIKAALPGMRARNWGRIINIASAHGLVASPFKAPMSPPSTAWSG